MNCAQYRAENGPLLTWSKALNFLFSGIPDATWTLLPHFSTVAFRYDLNLSKVDQKDGWHIFRSYILSSTYRSFNWLISDHSLSTYTSSSSRCRFRDWVASFGMIMESLLSLIKSTLISITESINARNFDFVASTCGIASSSFMRKSGQTSNYESQIVSLNAIHTKNTYIIWDLPEEVGWHCS